MAQRISGYPRLPNEDYATVEACPVAALVRCVSDMRVVWDPCPGEGELLTTLRRHGIQAVGTEHDFLTITEAPVDDAEIATNPPYGSRGRGEQAVAFIEHALALPVRRVSMLLPADFDSAISRQHLFRHRTNFSMKIVLLGRIRWIPNSTGSPSTNHAWYLWDRENVDAPTIRYVSKQEAA